MDSVSRAYAFAHYGKSLFWVASELLLAFYLGEAFGLQASTIGFFLFAFLLWDATTDPMVALLIARFGSSTKSLLVFQVIGAVTSGLFFCALFYVPDLNSQGLQIYVFMIGLAFRTTYTLYDLPQNTLLTRISKSAAGKVHLSAYRTAGSALAKITLAVTLAEIIDSREPQLLLVTSGAYVALAAISAVILARVGMHTAILTCTTESKAKVIYKTLHDHRLVRCYLAMFVLSAGWSAFGKLLPFYSKYVLLGADRLPLLYSTMAVAGTVAPLIATRYAHFWSNSHAWWTVVAATSVSGAAFIACDRDSDLHLLVAISMFAACSAIGSMMIWVTVAGHFNPAGRDVSSDTIAFGAFTFASKIGLGIGGLFIGWVLHSAEYLPDRLFLVDQIEVIVYSMVLAPIAGTMTASVLIAGPKAY